MTPDKRIRIGQIGIGHNHGSGKMAALRKLTDHFEVVGVVEADPEWRRKRENDAAYKGLKWLTEEELLATEGLDAIAVETDVPNLIPAAKRCLEAGYHIHLDKPGGETMGPFREVLELADSKNLLVQMAYMYRYTPAIQLCIKAAKEGWLGRIFEVHAVMSRMDGMDYRKWLGQFQGGAMYIFGCHLIDLVVSMLGAPDCVTPYLRRTWYEKDDLYDNGLAVMEYPHATATIRTAVVEVEGFRRRQLEVCGDKGSFEIQPLEYNGPKPKQTVVRLTLAEAAGGYEAGCHEFEMETPKGRYDSQLIDFAEMIRGNKPNPYPSSHELIVQEATLAASGCVGAE
jgi:predicted dehydrogenase